MPFVSEAQRRHFIANRADLEKQGVNVQEMIDASEGLKLPERVTKAAPTATQQAPRKVDPSAFNRFARK